MASDGEDHGLQHRRDEDDERARRTAPALTGGRLRGDEHENRVERAEVDERVDLNLLEEIGIRLPDARHLADRNALRDRAS